jgi:hypothetical protein
MVASTFIRLQVVVNRVELWIGLITLLLRSFCGAAFLVRHLVLVRHLAVLFSGDLAPGVLILI